MISCVVKYRFLLVNYKSFCTSGLVGSSIKHILKKKKRQGKWLAAQLEVDEGTVSRWCRNVQQPSLPTLFQIAELLEVPPADLLGEG